MGKIRLSEQLAIDLMREALIEATRAKQADEVPVGAVIWQDNKIIARAHNLVESRQDSTAHAEVLAIKEASQNLASWRLNDSVLAVTLEPCTMCLGAIKLARISHLIVGLMDPVKGVCGSVFDLTADTRLGPQINLISGILPEESEKLLKDFFKEKRK